MLLLPILAENRAVMRCVVIFDDGTLYNDFVSCNGLLLRRATRLEEPPAHLAEAVLDLFDDMPTHGLFQERFVRALRGHSATGETEHCRGRLPAAGELPRLHCPLPPSRPLARILSAASGREPLRGREMRLGTEWGLFEVAHHPAACVVFRSVETAVRQWQRAHPEAAAVPSEVLARRIHGLDAAQTAGRRACPSMAPTLASSPSSRLIHLASRSFVSIAQECELFGLPRKDVLHKALAALADESPSVAHSVLCRGVSLHASTAIFAFINGLGVLPCKWRVMSAFSGGGLFLAGLRQVVPYTLVGASDKSTVCQRLLQRCHPGVPVHRSATCRAATRDAPWADVFLAGFP